MGVKIPCAAAANMYNYQRECINIESIMIGKKARQGQILELIRSDEVRSQEELAFRLGSRGVEATQSTLSRDIRELGLIKIRGRYGLGSGGSGLLPEKELRRTLKQFVLGSALSGNILMIRTSPGNAHSVAVVLDGIHWPEVLGTVAGDDTVFALLRSAAVGRKVHRRIQELIA
jgi:transcriptional regulator of arginine metabolism